MTKIERMIKALGEDTLKDMEAMDADTLKKRIVEANEAMRQAYDELEANEKYQETKANLSALTEGKRGVNKRQNAVIGVALHLLNGDKEEASDAK